MQANECVIGDYRAAISHLGGGAGGGEERDAIGDTCLQLTLDGNCAMNLFMKLVRVISKSAS